MTGDARRPPKRRTTTPSQTAAGPIRFMARSVTEIIRRMDRPTRERWDSRDGEMSERRLLRSLEHEGYEVAVYAYRPGTSFDWHRHGEAKCDAVVAGTLRIEIDGGETFDL